MLSFIYKYFKCSLFRIYSLVGVENMCTFIQHISNVYCFAYIPESGKTICALLYQYVQCLQFRIYSRVGVNNMCTFIQQYFHCSLFHIYSCVGVHFYSNIAYVWCLTHVPVSGSIRRLHFKYANIVKIYCLGYMPMSGKILRVLLYSNTNALLFANISTCLQLSGRSLHWG